MAADKYNYTNEDGTVKQLSWLEYKKQMAVDIGVGQYAAYASSAVFDSENAPRANLYVNFRAAVNAIEAGKNNPKTRNGSTVNVRLASMNLLEEARQRLIEIDNDDTLHEKQKEVARKVVYEDLEMIKLANNSLGDAKWRGDFIAKLGEAFSKKNVEQTLAELVIAACATLIIGVIIGATLGVSGPLGWALLSAFVAYSFYKAFSWFSNAWKDANSKALDRKIEAGERLLDTEAAMAKSGLEKPKNELDGANAALAGPAAELAKQKATQEREKIAAAGLSSNIRSLIGKQKLINKVLKIDGLEATLSGAIVVESVDSGGYAVQQAKFEEIRVEINKVLPEGEKIAAKDIDAIKAKVIEFRDRRLPSIEREINQLASQLGTAKNSLKNRDRLIKYLESEVKTLKAIQVHKAGVYNKAVARNAKQEQIAANRDAQTSLKNRSKAARDAVFKKSSQASADSTSTMKAGKR